MGNAGGDREVEEKRTSIERKNPSEKLKRILVGLGGKRGEGNKPFLFLLENKGEKKRRLGTTSDW